MPSVRSSSATRLDVTEIGAQRYYKMSAWPIIWLLQSLGMMSQLRIIQEHVGLYGQVISIGEYLSLRIICFQKFFKNFQNIIFFFHTCCFCLLAFSFSSFFFSVFLFLSFSFSLSTPTC